MLPDIGNARAQARSVVREALRDREVVLEALGEDDCHDDLAHAYRAAYLWHARHVARDRLIDSLMRSGTTVLVYVLHFSLIVAIVAEAGALAVAFYLPGWMAGTFTLNGLASLVARLSLRFQLFCYVSAAAGVLTGAFVLRQELGPLVMLLDTVATDMSFVALTAAAATPVLIVAVLMPLYLAISWRQNRRAIREEPQPALLAQLFAVANALRDPRALIDGKASLLRWLDNAAVVLESEFWRAVPVTNPVSRVTWRERCWQCARRLRSFDLWIVLPRRDTHEELRAEIASLIHVLVRGCLDELPTAEPRPRGKLAVFGSVARSLFLGLIPLAAVLGAKFAGLDLSGALGGALVVAATAWFALTVLTTFDGQATTRVALLKDAAEAMASFRGGKP